MKDIVAVITGGSRGLGKETAKQLLAKGHTVVICAREKEEVEQTAGEIGAVPFVADVTKQEYLEALAEFTASRFGRIDLWINNAGVWLPHMPFEEIDLARVRSIFEVNVFGAMYGAKAALTRMHKQGQGTLVNIVSVSALSGRPNSSGYAASKWAVRGFTDSIREEYRGTGVTVIGVYPDRMKTDLFDESLPEDIENYMTPESVATRIVENLELAGPVEELVITKAG